MSDRPTSCEVHVPISPTPSFLLRTRLLAASLERFSGLDCRLVVSVSRDVEPYDLHAAEPWSREAGVAWRWTDPKLYAAHGTYGTAMARFRYDFEAPFVLLLDADTLCTGSLAELSALAGDGVAGVMAWVTPLLERPTFRHAPAPTPERFWPELFASAGLPEPQLDQEHPGWRVMNDVPAHRRAPAYFNLGMLAGTSAAMRTVGASIMSELERVERFADTRFRCQLALTLAAARTATPLTPLPLRFNFPNNYWFWDGYPDQRDVRLLHYAQTEEIDRDELRSVADLEALAVRTELSPPSALMRDCVLDLLSSLKARSAYPARSMTSASPASQPVVVVLGFHRSGTSMVTRMLNLLGVDLGDEASLLPPEERDNACGYWEPRWMIELNDEILAVLGTSAFAPFRAEPGWERSPALDALRARARSLLDEHFADRPLWGWKDPRTSLTLPFWREVVDAPLRCVVCVRSPADAVASALERDIPGIDRWQYGERWLEHTENALANTAPEERILVFYDDALRDPSGETRRIAAFLGIPEPSDEQLDRIAASVDPDLRHHTTSPWHVAVDRGLPVETRALFLLLRARKSLEELPEGGTPARLPSALERLAPELGMARRQAAVAQDCGERLQAVERRLHEREGQLAQRGAELAERDARLAERERTIATLAESRSWRLTRPLRTLGRVMRRDR